MFSKFILNKVCEDIMYFDSLNKLESEFLISFIKSNIDNLAICTEVHPSLSEETVSLTFSTHTPIIGLFYRNDVLYHISYDLVKMVNFNTDCYNTLCELVLKANESLKLDSHSSPNIKVVFNDLNLDGLFYLNTRELSVFMFDRVSIVVKDFLDYYCKDLYSKFVIVFGEKSLNDDNFFEILEQELFYNYSELFKIKLVI